MEVSRAADRLRSNPTIVVAASRLLLVSVVVLAVSCGDDGSSSATGVEHPKTLSSAAERTTSSGASSPTSVPNPAFDAANLVPCDPDAESYNTLPDWLATELPAGVHLTVARTGVWTMDTADGPSPSRHLLVEVDNDRVVSSVYLVRGVSPDVQAGFNLVEEDERLDSVRGLPGQIGHWVNRGDSVGYQVAEWTEGGVLWKAISQLDVRSLGAALASFRINGEEVSDPSDSFQVIGEGPSFIPGRPRTTDLEYEEFDDRGELFRRYYVRIDSPVPGATGIIEGSADPGATMSAVDGRVVLTHGPDVSSSLGDGSPVSIRTYDATSNPTDSDTGTVRRLLSALRRRTPEDRAQPGTIEFLSQAAGKDLESEYCKEQ